MRTTLVLLLLPLSVLSSLGLPAAARSCHPASEAARYEGKDICISAHVYDIAQLRDGTRFLDTCSPETSDADCRFTIASLPEDTRDVGDLNALRGKDIELRGTVHSVNDRSLIYLSTARQLHGGTEKFHPNPALLAGFSAEQGKTPVHDPSLSGNHHFSVFRATR
ncbi:MAG TPA: hypothetical protein VH139_09190 [Acidobacteriaceae bacterium]|nr:hypothetical protein [Acidobacteriaceae bacterium]